jgi:hypothetical protein
MRRRDFIGVVCGAALASRGVEAQQPAKVWRIGNVVPRTAEQGESYVKALEARLADLGYVEGRNIVLLHRFAEPQPDHKKSRRSRANLRARSRSASVIDDCSKIRTRRKIVMIFDHPRRTLVLDRRPGNRAAILRSEIHRHRSHGCSDRRCSARAFDDSTARRSAAAASRGPRLDAHALAGDFDNRTTGSSTLFSR